MMNQKRIMFALSLVMGAAICAALLTRPAFAQKPALPPGTALLSGDLRSFAAYGVAPEKAGFAVVPVTGQPFPEALQLTTITTPPRFYDYGATAPLLAPLHSGDLLWVSLWARRVSTRRESGEAEVEVALLQKTAGGEVRPLERRLSFGPQWTQYRLPFTVRTDSNEARLGFRFGYGRQSIEIGGVQLLRFGPGVRESDLPKTVIRYEGWQPDAQWRKAASARIEKYRKGDLLVRVVDAAGKPVANADVQVRMKRHAFAWGTAVDDSRINDTQDPDNARYRQIVETYYNKVVIENNLKWGRWIEPKYRTSALASLPWFEERHIAVRGHVMLWPSWQHTPSFVAAFKNDPSALRKAISDHITDQNDAVHGRLAEWDVINETFKHHDLLDILGRGEMIDWFQQAHKGAPNTKLFYNDYTMFQPGEGQQYFYDTVKFLKDGGAPIDAIGEQGHFASSPPGIPDVLATLDKFGGLGLPIQISEFDIDTDDTGLQADFMRDFTTAVFSHPSVMGVMQWGFWQKAHWLPRAALWDNDWNLRPNGKVWTDLVTKTWWTNADGKTNKTGSYAVRCFYGDYTLSVTKNGKTQSLPFALLPAQSGVATVTLP